MTEFFRFGFPEYSRKSVFKDKVEIVLDRSGAVIGATNSDKLENLRIPAAAEELSLSDIAPGAFRGLANLKTLTIEDGLEEIGDEAFRDCRSLLTAEIAKSVYKIGAGAFENCCNLKIADLPEGLEEITSRAFYGCRSLVAMKIPCTVKKIGAMAFASTHSLKSVVLPDSLDEISEGLFMDSWIERIEIPASIRRIGSAAFSRARNLKNIYYNGTIDGFRRISFGLHWNSSIPSDASLFIKDRNGNYYNAFSGEENVNNSSESDEKEKMALKVLGLEMGCSRKDIERAFREKAKHFHPDVLSGKDLDPEFTEFAASRFRELQEAEEYLLRNRH